MFGAMIDENDHNRAGNWILRQNGAYVYEKKFKREILKIEGKGTTKWSAHSPDLSPLDFLKGAFKQNFMQHNANHSIIHKCNLIAPEMSHNVRKHYIENNLINWT